jgi:hypothetical protein
VYFHYPAGKFNDVITLQYSNHTTQTGEIIGVVEIWGEGIWRNGKERGWGFTIK